MRAWCPVSSASRRSRARCSRSSPLMRRLRRADVVTVSAGCSVSTLVLLLARALADRACDDSALDLAGALEQRVDLGVAMPALDRQLADVAPASADADRLVGHPVGDLAGLELGHRTLRLVELLRVASHPRRAPAEHAGRLDLGGHVSEQEGDRLVADDRAAELDTGGRVVERVLIRGAGDADCLGADCRARELQGAQRAAVALFGVARRRTGGRVLLAGPG